MKSLSLSVMRQRNFRFLAFTRMFATMALQAQAIIVGWQVYSLTHQPFMLGLVGLTEAVPAIICALVAGHIVDISKPIRVYLTCIAALTANTFMLMLVGGGLIPMSSFNVLAFIFAGVFISGVARSFIMPASFSILPQVVARKDIPSATGWTNTGFQIAVIGGPALAGIIYGGYGPRGAWLMPTSLFAVAFVMMNFIKVPDTVRAAEKRDPAIKSIRAGWSFILQNPVLLSLMALDMFAVLFGGAVAMLPAYADQVLHVGSEGLGALRAAPAVGAIISALIFATQPMKKLSGKRMLIVVAGFGVSMIGFGLSHSFALSFFFLVLSGAFDSVSVIIRTTIMQLVTPERMRGRVSAVNSMFIISSNELGAFESGVAAHFLGLIPSVALGGVAALFVVAATAIASPKFRNTVVESES